MEHGVWNTNASYKQSIGDSGFFLVYVIDHPHSLFWYMGDILDRLGTIQGAY